MLNWLQRVRVRLSISANLFLVVNLYLLSLKFYSLLLYSFSEAVKTGSGSGSTRNPISIFKKTKDFFFTLLNSTAITTSQSTLAFQLPAITISTRNLCALTVALLIG